MTCSILEIRATGPVTEVVLADHVVADADLAPAVGDAAFAEARRGPLGSLVLVRLALQGHRGGEVEAVAGVERLLLDGAGVGEGEQVELPRRTPRPSTPLRSRRSVSRRARAPRSCSGRAAAASRPFPTWGAPSARRTGPVRTSSPLGDERVGVAGAPPSPRIRFHHGKRVDRAPRLFTLRKVGSVRDVTQSTLVDSPASLTNPPRRPPPSSSPSPRESTTSAPSTSWSPATPRRRCPISASTSSRRSGATSGCGTCRSSSAPPSATSSATSRR